MIASDYPIRLLNTLRSMTYCPTGLGEGFKPGVTMQRIETPHVGHGITGTQWLVAGIFRVRMIDPWGDYYFGCMLDDRGEIIAKRREDQDILMRLWQDGSLGDILVPIHGDDQMWKRAFVLNSAGYRMRCTLEHMVRPGTSTRAVSFDVDPMDVALARQAMDVGSVMPGASVRL